MLLIIGNKRLSSWSLRPWLLLKHYQIPFNEKLIPLDQPTTVQEIAQHSPSGKVPALQHGDVHIWDSLAISEYLNEQFPEKQMWPKDPAQRAHARAISSEMHSGFPKMRQLLSHDLQKHIKGFDWSPAAADIKRVKEIWTECLRASGGPFLFGQFSIADCMFAPVVNRFITYDVAVEGVISNYVKTIREMPEHQEWIKAGLAETYTADFH